MVDTNAVNVRRLKFRSFLVVMGMFLVLMIAPAMAQAPTDILVVEMAALQEGSPQIVNITDRDGYDNQPSFTADGESILYTSIRDEQADIYRYDLATGSTSQLTQTAESEYSPTVVPAGDGFSVIRVEADETQRLWRFDLDGQNPSLVLESVRDIGYHAWGDANTVALFVIDEPLKLQIADVETEETETVAENIGRSLHKVPGERAISFVYKESEDVWLIQTFNLDTRETTTLTETLPGREDYAWLPDGRLLMADGAVLYQWTPGSDAWQELADFSSAGASNITRLAVSPQGDRLALVTDRPE